MRNRSTWLVAALVAMLVAACAEQDPTGVEVPTVARVDVAPSNRVLAVGDTMRLTAYPKAANGTVLGSVAIAWRSMGEGVATIQSHGITGLVKAIAPGTVRIEAESEGKIGFVNVTVVAAPLVVSSIEIQPSDVALDIGQQHTFEAIVKAADGTVIGGRTVTWSTSWAPMATVVGGANGAFAVVTAHATGLVKIRATVEGKTAEANVQVRAPQAPVAFVHFNTQKRGVWVNMVTAYAQDVRVLSQNGTPLEGREIVWSVTDPTVASVDQQGNVRALKAGTTFVRATSEGKTGATQLVVFAQPQGDAVYDLTYDWWDGNFRPLQGVGTVPWTDNDGVEHQLTLYLTGGTMTMRDNGTYERVLKLEAWAVVNGVNVVVVTQNVVDRGNAWIKVGGETGYDLISTMNPGLQYEAVSWAHAGHIVVRQPVGTAPVQPYLFRLRQ